MALLDRERYPDIITATDALENAEPHYTNSSQLPVNFTQDMFEALDHQDELQTKYTGGTILHLFLGEEVTDIRTIRNLIKTVVSNYKLPYISVTPTFSICPEHGYRKGKEPVCGDCGSEAEVYTRIVGYYRPISAWNRGKQAESEMRLMFDSPAASMLDS